MTLLPTSLPNNPAYAVSADAWNELVADIGGGGTPPSPVPSLYTNDFSAGQAIDTTDIATYYTTSPGAPSASGNMLTLATAAAQACGIVHKVSVAKDTANTWTHKAEVTSLANTQWMNLLGVRAAASQPGYIHVANEDCKIMCALFRDTGSSPYYFIRVMYMNSAGAWQQWSPSSQTFGTAAASWGAAISTYYTVRFQTDPNGGTPRWRFVVCDASGTPIANMTTSWVNFSSVQNDATNTYWVEAGDRFDDYYNGTMDLTLLSKI